MMKPMVDFIRMPAISARLREPLAAALSGEKTAWPDGLTADELAALVEHGVAPLAYAGGARQLRDVALSAAVAEPLRLRELRAVIDALAARGVRPLLLKGAALAYSIYAEGELRPRADCDLLITREQLDIAAEVFSANGYQMSIDSGDELALRQRSFARTDSFGVDHFFDVHWAITNTPVFASVLRYDELMMRAVPLPRIGGSAIGLGAVDALLLACIHRVAHHHDSDRLIWLCDVHLLRRALSRDELRMFWELAADRRVVAVCRRTFQLEAEFFGGDANDGASEWLTAAQLNADEPSRAFLDREQTHGGVLAANLAALTWLGRLQRLRQLAFPPRAFMKAQFPDRPSAALPLLYAFRGLRGIARLFRKVA
jgi:hypothetical protein